MQFLPPDVKVMQFEILTRMQRLGQMLGSAWFGGVWGRGRDAGGGWLQENARWNMHARIRIFGYGKVVLDGEMQETRG
jgi:hypothetical protein